MLNLFEDDSRALRHAEEVLEEDPRFEHLDRKLSRHMWHFVCQASLDHKTDFVPEFIAEHHREVVATTCFMAVESLTVKGETEVSGMRLLPVDHPNVPPADGRFRLDPPVGSVFAVPCEGTNYARMAERAAAHAEQALRVLRVAMRADQFVHNRQLRFRLSRSYSFGEGLSGWALHPDAAWEVELGKSMLDTVSGQPVSQLPLMAETDVDRKAALALRWLEQAQLATDEIVELLYLFFALEALLGDKSEGLKAHGLALRRALLGIAVKGSFSHPSRAFVLYDQVRSLAVHGEHPPEVDPELVRSFAWDVRRAINEYVEFARDNKLAKRGKLLRALDSQEKRPELEAWLLEEDPDTWSKYLGDQTEG